MSPTPSERVLIVEDEPSTRVGLTELVRTWGFTADSAGDGEEALQRITVFRPSIIISDLVMLFKFGSGTGSNLSSIRSSKELLAGGGTASGPVSFMKGYDAFAGVIKSGGKTRRAAKMVILNADHPDVMEFINCKVEEEKKACSSTRR